MAKWRLLKSDTVLSTPWLSVLKNQYEVAKGKIIDDFYIIRRNNFVAIVALHDSKLILVRQYRPAIDKVVLSLPAGLLDSGESPEAAALRELREETGFSAATCEVIAELHPSPGYTQSRAFVALCEASPNDSGRTDQFEIDEVVQVEWEEALRMVASGDINDLPSVSAILLAKEALARRSHN